MARRSMDKMRLQTSLTDQISSLSFVQTVVAVVIFSLTYAISYGEAAKESHLPSNN